MTLSSAAFNNNGVIPTEYTCDSENISPPLSWTGAPKGTDSLVLTMIDPNANDIPAGYWDHWVIFDIPSSMNNLPTNISMNNAEGLNGRKNANYDGPCPPTGKRVYEFKLYALDTSLNFDTAPDRQEVLQAMKGHVIDEATLHAAYTRHEANNGLATEAEPVNKLIVVTGAASGIGRETAIFFADKGYKVALFDIDMSQINDVNKPNFFKRTLDVRNRDDFVKAVDEAEEHFGLPVDAFFNIAGIMPLGEFATQDPVDWDRLVDTNVKGALNGIYATYPRMLKQKRGHIFNMSSMAGRKIFDNHGVYVATKHAVHAISDQLRKEAGGFGICVSTIAPGATKTNLLRRDNDPKTVFEYEERVDAGGGYMDAKYIVESMYFIYQLPDNVCVREINLTTTGGE